MDGNKVVYWLTWLNTICWGVCFWWMHRISSRQDAVLKQLRGQARRIEGLSQAEHDLIKDVHPQVGEIKEGVQKVVEAVRDEVETASAAKKKSPAGTPRKP